MAGEDEDVTIDLRLRDYLSSGADSAADELEDLARETRKVNRQLLLLDKRADKAADSLLKLAAATRAYNVAQHQSMGGFEALNKQMVQFNKNTKQAAKSQAVLDKNSSKANQTLKKSNNLLRMVGRTARMAAAGLMLVGAAMGAMSVASLAGPAAQGILGIAVALSSLLSFAALYPVAIGSIIAITTTAKVAFAGMGEAMKAAFSGDPEKLKEAMKELSPLAQRFVKEMIPFVKQIKSMKQIIQDSLFRPLVGTLEPFLGRVLPTLRSGMAFLAHDLGLFIKEFMMFFRMDKGLNTLMNFFKSGASLVREMKRGLMPFMTGLGQMIQTVMPYWERFTKLIGDVMIRLGGWLGEISSDGRLTGWLDTAIDTVKILFDVMMDIGQIIKDILNAAGADAGALGIFGAVIKDIAKWTSSLEGQNALSSFFSSLQTIAKALAPILLTVANAIGTVLAPAIADIVTGLAPGFTVFLKALVTGLAALGPYWGPLAKAIGDVLIALAPLLPVIGEMAGLLGGYLTMALRAITPLLQFLATALSTFLVPYLAAAAAAFEMIQPYLNDFFAIFQSGMQAMMPILQEFGVLFGQMLVTHLGRIMEMLPTIIPLIMQLGMAFMTHLMQALIMLRPHMPAIIQAMGEFMNLGLQLLPIILQLGILFLGVATKMLPFIGMIFRVIAALAAFAGMVAGVAARFIAAVSSIISWGASMATRLRAAVSGLGETLAAPFRAAKSGIMGAIDSISGAISGLIDKVGGLISKIQGLGSIDLNPFKFAGGDVEAGQKYTVGEIGPEMYVPDFGKPQMIGTGGMETRSFGSDGFIIPSFMLDMLSKVESSMARELSRMDFGSGSSGRELAQVAAALSSGELGKTENHYHMPITIMGNVTEEVDIERAVSKALKKAKKDSEERG